MPDLFCKHLGAEEHQRQRREVFRFLTDPEERQGYLGQDPEGSGDGEGQKVERQDSAQPEGR